MEIFFETRSVEAFREGVHQIKRTQLSMESVVPDVYDDIGRLFFTQTNLYLKSKDLTSYGAAVSGELAVTLLFINEAGDRVFDLHMTQGFSLDFEIPEPDPDLLTQVKLFVSSTEARAVNPRKVSVTVELGGELFGYKKEKCIVASVPPAGQETPICVKTEKTDSTLVNAVTEKTFVINEQFPFSGGKAAPDRIVSHQADFRVSDCQLIGSKLLIKGTLCVNVCYLSEDCRYPIAAGFSAPFSQLMELGQEQMDGAAVRMEISSAYYSIVELIGGEKALDAEIHAVAQIVSRFRQPIESVSDAYCSRMPSELCYDSLRYVNESKAPPLLLNAEERVELPEECDDLLAVFPTLGQSRLENGKAEANLLLDALCREKDGTLQCFRRMLVLSGECPAVNASLESVRLTDASFRPDGSVLTARLSVEMQYTDRTEKELNCVSSMTLQEDEAYDSAKIPSFTAVRVDRESVWDLAKTYHSSCDRIEAFNDLGSPLRGRMLLIPKCL